MTLHSFNFLSWLTITPYVANLSGVRTFRVLRALRTISQTKGNIFIKVFSLSDDPGLANRKYTRKNAQVVTSLQTSCNRSVHKLSTSCVRTACS